MTTKINVLSTDTSFYCFSWLGTLQHCTAYCRVNNAKVFLLWLISLSEANLVVRFSESEKTADNASLEETDKVSPLIQAQMPFLRAKKGKPSTPQHRPQVRAVICFLRSVLVSSWGEYLRYLLSRSPGEGARLFQSSAVYMWVNSLSNTKRQFCRRWSVPGVLLKS